MKKTRFTDTQIVHILKQAEQGVPIADLCCDHNIAKGPSTTGVLNMEAWMLCSSLISKSLRIS